VRQPPSEQSVVVLLPDTHRLRQDFNDEQAELRLLSVASPTCDQCRAGLNLVLDTVENTPGVAAFVLWIAMLDGDTQQTANEAAVGLPVDASVSQYWEEEGWPVSARLRSVLGIGPYDPTQSAWDVHLLYLRGAAWEGDAPPPPAAWAYNLLDDLCVGERLSARVVRRWMSEWISS
jgi:hypothetical protein